MSAILDYLPWLVSVPLLGIIIAILLNPEKAERWSADLSRAFAWANNKAEKATVARDIQGRVGEFRKSLGEAGQEIMPHGLKVKWKNVASPSAQLEDGEIVVVMKEHSSQPKNFLTAILAYIPEGLMPQARHYIRPKMMRAIDLVIARKIVMTERIDALSMFQSEVLDPEFKADLQLFQLGESLTSLDDSGLLTRIALPEASSYGRKLWPSPPKAADSRPVDELVRMLSDMVSKPPGVDIPPNVVNTENLNLCIVPVAKSSTLAYAGTDPHVKFVRDQAGAGVKNFYVTSSLRNRVIAISLARRLVNSGFFSIDSEETFSAQRGRRKDVYLAKLHLVKPIE